MSQHANATIGDWPYNQYPWPYNWRWVTNSVLSPPIVVPCVHCYCEDDKSHPEHLICCKCYGRMHKKFVAGT